MYGRGPLILLKHLDKDLFGKDPVAALRILADEFIRSAVTKIMPVMTPEMTASNRYRRTAEAARNGNLSKAGAVLDDDSIRSDLGREEVVEQVQAPPPPPPPPIAAGAEGEGTNDEEGMNVDAGEEMNEIKAEHLLNALTKGSSAGPDGLPPQLLMELIKDDDICCTVLENLATRMASLRAMPSSWHQVQPLPLRSQDRTRYGPSASLPASDEQWQV
jgi:hypothetical protein